MVDPGNRALIINDHAPPNNYPFYKFVKNRQTLIPLWSPYA
jgi:hypothetical protein